MKAAARSGPARRRRHRAPGFTLIELIVVMILTGILAAVALPRIVQPDVFAARAAADSVQSTLRYAQQSAIAMRRNVCIAASTTLLTVTYAGTAGAAQTCAAGNAVVNPGNGKPFGDSSNALPRSATLAAPTTLVFDAQGKPYASVGNPLASARTLTVNGYPTAITVEPETGLVH